MRDIVLKIHYEVKKEYNAFGLKNIVSTFAQCQIMWKLITKQNSLILLPIFNNAARSDSWGSRVKKTHIVALNLSRPLRTPRMLVNKWFLTCMPAAFAWGSSEEFTHLTLVSRFL